MSSEIFACQFHSWYPLFRKHTFRSRIIPLPQNFVDFLNADSLFLPSSSIPPHSQNDDDESDTDTDWTTTDSSNQQSSGSSSNLPQSLASIVAQQERADESTGETDETLGDDVDGQAWADSFNPLCASIDAAIKELGGGMQHCDSFIAWILILFVLLAVFPKLNFSSPKDASFMNPGTTLQCTSSSDVILLLKSSDCIARDIELVYAQTTE